MAQTLFLDLTEIALIYRYQCDSSFIMLTYDKVLEFSHEINESLKMINSPFKIVSQSMSEHYFAGRDEIGTLYVILKPNITINEIDTFRKKYCAYLPLDVLKVLNMSNVLTTIG